jgi:hypothetical protein
MPYKSKAQAAYVHARANAGEPWAKRFAAHSSGQSLKGLPKRKGGQYHLKKEGRRHGHA